MARCGCTDGGVAITGDGIASVDGVGTPDNPYIIRIGGLLAGHSVIYDAVQTLTPTQQAQARANIGVTPGTSTNILVRPEDAPYGAVGDGVTDDAPAIQAAIDALNAAGGGILLFTKRYYRCASALTMRTGVTLTAMRAHRSLIGNSGSTLLFDALTGPAITVASASVGAAFYGMNIQGQTGGTSTVGSGVMVSDLAYNIAFEKMTIGGFSDSAITSAGHPTSITIYDCALVCDTSGRTLTTPVGALHLVGSDHYVRAVQCNAGPSAPGNVDGRHNVVYSTGLYRCGAYINCITSSFWDLNGEFGDCGVYLDTGAGNNRFIGTRGDANAGHGWYILGHDNQFDGCAAFECGIAAAFAGGANLDRWDGVCHDGSAARNVWTNYQYGPGGLPANRFGWYDKVATNSRFDSNSVTTRASGTIRGAGSVTELFRSEKPYFSIYPPGAGSSYDRPAARYMMGSTWFDTTLNLPVYSDGLWWKDMGGEVIGNVCTPQQSIGLNPTAAGFAFEMAPGDVNSAVTGVISYPTGSAQGLLFLENSYLAFTLNAAGATAGKFEAWMDNIGGGGQHVAVVAGKTYTVGVQSIKQSGAVGTVTINVDWFNAANALIGSTGYLAMTGGTVNNGTTVTTHYLQGQTAPALAVSARIKIRFTGSYANGDITLVQHLFMVPFAATGYVEA